LCLHFSKEQAKKTLKRDVGLSVEEFTEEKLVKLSNGEVLQLIAKLSKWLRANVKSPSIAMVTCESFLIRATMLLYNDLFREYMTPVRKTKEIEEMLLSMLSAALNLRA
jgi:hypothetical protein